MVFNNQVRSFVNLCKCNQESLKFRISAKNFLSFPQKNLPPEKIYINKVFTFQLLTDKIDPNTNLAKLPKVQNDFFLDIAVNTIIQKLKSKHLVCLSFLRWEVFFEGTRENILHIFRAWGQGFFLFSLTLVLWLSFSGSQVIIKKSSNDNYFCSKFELTSF